MPSAELQSPRSRSDGRVLRIGVALLMLAPFAWAESSIELENGLTVHVISRPVDSTCAILVSYAVGEDHDPPGRSGLAHLAEHLYVCGATEGTPARTVSEYVRRYPDGWNAQTLADATIFATLFDVERLDEELADASSRMQEIDVSPEVFERERQHVLVEVENMFRVPALALPNHARELVRPSPNGGRRGGLPEHVRAITVEDVEDHLERRLSVVNATLVVVAPLSVAEIEQRVRRAFDFEAPVATPSPSTPDEARGARRSTTKRITGEPGVAIAVRAPDLSGPDAAPFLVGVARLTAASTRSGFSITYPVLEAPEVVIVYAQPRAEESVDDLRARLERNIDRVLATPTNSGDGFLVGAVFGRTLGLTASGRLDAIAGGSSYTEALQRVRTAAIGVDRARLRDELAVLREEEFRTVVSKFFGPEARGVVLSRPAD